MRKYPGYFITLEGIEGAGKSTAIQIIQSFFSEQKKELQVTREPGGTEIAEAIRKVLLDHYHEKMVPEAELLLNFASRAQHIECVIKPALMAGKTVLSDRFTDASFAYQGAGRGLSDRYLSFLSNWIQGEIIPDLTILLDVPSETGLKRIGLRGEKDRYEHEQQEFFERVRQCYLERAQQYPQRFRVIDTSCSKEAMEQGIIHLLQHRLTEFHHHERC